MNAERHMVCTKCKAVNRLPGGRDPLTSKCGACKSPLFTREPAEVDTDTLRKLMARSDVPVLVDFWAPWCGPCRTMGPQLARAAQDLEPSVRVVKLNTDAHPQIAGELAIRGIPTLVLWSGGKEIARTSGAQDAGSLGGWVRSNLR